MHVPCASRPMNAGRSRLPEAGPERSPSTSLAASPPISSTRRPQPLFAGRRLSNAYHDSMARSRTSDGGRREATPLLSRVGALVDHLRDLGFAPILVGGMALVALGSRRVTRDFDFVLATPGDRLSPLVDALYAAGLELAARLDSDGEVVATIDNPRVAAARLRIDGPPSAFFFDRRTRFRVDLLFDFPLPAADLARRATRIRVQSVDLDVAGVDDLLTLKTIARAERVAAGDAEDVAYLQRLVRRKRKARPGQP